MSDSSMVDDVSENNDKNNECTTLLKDSSEIFSKQSAHQSGIIHKNLDSNCLYSFEESLLRIEYPGNVKNVDRAVETLGGIDEIQKALFGNKLELCYHPKNLHMKPSLGDIDNNVGLLIKVKKYPKIMNEIKYEIIGAVDTNFKFNRMCDFQYLPLASKTNPETKQSDVEYLYDKIILDKIPTLDWFNKKKSENSLFLISGNFARFDQPQIRFQLNSTDVFNSIIRSDAPQMSDFNKKKHKIKFSTMSIKILPHEDTEIPLEPLPGALDNVKSNFLQQQLKLHQKLFEERPIWTKPAIMHRANVNNESTKHCLPCVAYYCYGGPWRACWIKFGYNPITDFNSRIYQILDFRIRHTDGMQMKVKAKRTVSNNIARNFDSKEITDINYVIRPNQIPPARQMLYQYCDILIPEIQEMISKLPKLPVSAKFNAKNGWLPLNFQEHCREIVNRYVFEAVQQEMLKESKLQRSVVNQNPETITNYCSKMLTNMKKGFSIQSISSSSSSSATASTTVSSSNNNNNNNNNKDQEEILIDEQIIDLSDDEEIDLNQLMEGLPERIDDADEEVDSDLEIDLEAVEDVNEIVADFMNKT